jgi:predicted thioesterase
MEKELKVGLKGTQTITVTKDLTAKALGSGTLDVYATPAMIALMENTAYNSVQPYLEEGQGSVGTSLNVKHLSASPIGMEIVCETTLTEIDRRRLVFEVKAFDRSGCIGEGTHERFLVMNDSFQKKADSKLDA